MRRSHVTVLGGVLLAAAAAAASAPARDIEDEFNSRIHVRRIVRLGKDTKDISSVCWSADGARLLVDRKKYDRYYAVQVLDWKRLLAGDRDHAAPLSDARDGGATTQNWNNSTPAWRGDNRLAAFSGQAENGRDFQRSGPFFGLECDLWLADLPGRRFWRMLPEYPGGARPLGVTAPAFSPDGRWLAWTATTAPPRPGRYYGDRRLALGRIRHRPGEPPRIAPVRMPALPGDGGFVETCCFSRDGARLYFAANLARPAGQPVNWYDMDIYAWDFLKKDAAPVPLTASDAWDRYASLSPKGRKIIWSCGDGFLQPPVGMQGSSWNRYLRSELWIMDADGRNKKPLTRFNDRNAREFLGRRCYVGASAWHPDGNRIALVVYTEGANFNPESHLHLLELDAGIRTPGGRVVPLEESRARTPKPKPPVPAR